MTALRRQAGISVIELMIAITISLFLLVGVVSVFGNSNQVYMEISRASQQIENGRFAIQILADDVGMAGFYGRYAQQLTVTGTPDPCEITTMATLRNNGAAWPIQGYNAPASSPITTCLPDENHVPGTDVLVVRRADTQVTASGSLVAAQVYMQANADSNSSTSPIINLGTAANFTLKNKDLTDAPIRKYHVHVYFISPCSVPSDGSTTCTGATDDGGRPIPTLKRLELTIDPSDGARKMVVTPLVEGIEQMQVDYAIDADADGAPDGAYVVAPAAADWPNVISVRISVLARNLEPSADYSDARKYDMGVMGTMSAPSAGGTVATLAANYKRHAYNAVVRIVNLSARRES